MQGNVKALLSRQVTARSLHDSIDSEVMRTQSDCFTSCRVSTAGRRRNLQKELVIVNISRTEEQAQWDIVP